MTLYEGMFLLDNDVVRAGWDQAKAAVTETLEKHGGTIRTARRWGERKLAYTIKKRKRATYLLTYFDGSQDTVTLSTRELDLRDDVLRYLVLQVEAIPAGEEDLAQAEAAPDFVVPEPPADDEPDEAPATEEEASGGGRERSSEAKTDSEGDSDAGGDKPAEGDGSSKEEASEAPKADAAGDEAKTEGGAETEKVAATPTESTEGK